jgi:hypothetical protein
MPPQRDAAQCSHGFLPPIRCFASLGRTSSESTDSQPQFLENVGCGGGIFGEASSLSLYAAQNPRAEQAGNILDEANGTKIT